MSGVSGQYSQNTVKLQLIQLDSYFFILEKFEKMKLVICLSFCVILTAGVQIVPKTLTREIKADVLRGNLVSDFYYQNEE